MAYEIIVAKFTPDEPDERIDAVLPDGVVGIGAKAFRFKGEVRSLRAPKASSRWGMPLSMAAATSCRSTFQAMSLWWESALSNTVPRCAR